MSSTQRRGSTLKFAVNHQTYVMPKPSEKTASPQNQTAASKHLDTVDTIDHADTNQPRPLTTRKTAPQPEVLLEPLRVDRDEVRGKLWIFLPPGTTKAERDKRVNTALTNALYDAAKVMGVVLDTDPHSFAQLTGLMDDEKRTEFVIQGRIEGDRLVPIRLRPRRRK